MKIIPQHQTFITEYMKDRDGQAAAIRAGYPAKSARVKASQILARPEVRAEVERRMAKIAERADVKAEDVLRELRRVAMVDIKNFFGTNGELLELHSMPEDHRRAIAGVDEDELFEGFGREREKIGVTKKIKLFDKVKALELLGKYFKLFTDKVEVDDVTGLAERMMKARDRAKNASKHR